MIEPEETIDFSGLFREMGQIHVFASGSTHIGAHEHQVHAMGDAFHMPSSRRYGCSRVRCGGAVRAFSARGLAKTGSFGAKIKIHRKLTQNTVPDTVRLLSTAIDALW